MLSPGRPAMNGHFARPRTLAPAPAREDGIFVRMAAYRDPECAWTVSDAFAKADRPERVFFGICWQYQPDVDEPFPALEHPEQVRFTRVAADISRGVCWARHQAERLWRREAYTLQVDSHSRFAPGWDSRLIDELARCPSPKAILSTNPAGYAPPAQLEANPSPLVRCARPFGQDGELRFEARYPEASFSAPVRSAFIAGGFLFSRGAVLSEVPYDPHLYFNQEEAAYTLRLFTHGWDVFTPSIVAVYHYYNPGGSREKSVRPLHWHENAAWGNMSHRSRLRFDHLTRHRLSEDPEVIAELDRFGLGAARSLEHFEAFAGVDFRNKRVSERATKGRVDASVLEAAPPTAVVPETTTDGDPARRPPARAAILSDAPADDPPLPRSPPRLPPSPAVALADGAATEPALRVGAFVPYLTLADEAGQQRRIHDYGGAFTALHVLPSAEPGAYRRFFAALARHAHTTGGLQPVLVLPLPQSRLRGIKRRYAVDHPLWSDADLRVSRLVGALGGRAARTAPGAVTCLINPNLQVVKIYRAGDAEHQLEELARDAATWSRPPALARAGAHAPVLLIPDVLTTAECARAVEYFKTGRRFPGTVGAGARTRYDERNKIRTDCEVRGDFLPELDRVFAQTMFPEVRKVFGFAVTHREAYKIGCYDAERGGFFYRHRDNADPELAYRRCAVSVNLNEGYEGGELHFPEYGGALYRPEPGAALVFPCSLMHRVVRLGAGTRYTMISFLFGEEDARLWVARHGVERARELESRRVGPALA